MKKNNLFYILILGLCFASFAFIYGCGSNATGGGGGGGGSTIQNRKGVYSYSGTQASGDAWSWTISTSELIGTNETTGMWMAGTWKTLPSGFGKATVVTSEGAGAPQVGSKAHFLEYPDTMLLIHPSDSNDDRIMVCAASATLEPATGRYVFVKIPKMNWTTADAALGTVDARTAGTGKFEFDITEYLITGEKTGDHSGVGDPFIYLNGTFTQEAGTDPTEIFMTPSGMFIGDNGPGKGGFAGGIANVDPYVFTTEAISHTYKGVRFIYYPSGTGETEPATASYFCPKTVKATSYSNVDTGSIDNRGYVIITFEASSVPGFMQGDITGFDTGGGGGGGGTHKEYLQCVASKVHSDRLNKDLYLFFGIGHDDSNRAFNILMIQSN